MVSQLKSPKQYLLNRDGLTTKVNSNLTSTNLEILSPTIRGQQIKAKNNSNFEGNNNEWNNLYDTTRRNVE